MRLAFVLLLLMMLTGCTAMVLGNGSSGGAAPSASSVADGAVVARVKEALQADLALRISNLSVRSYSGAVILSGTATTQADREKAARLAKATAGVKTVTNQILVE